MHEVSAEVAGAKLGELFCIAAVGKRVGSIRDKHRLILEPQFVSGEGVLTRRARLILPL